MHIPHSLSLTHSLSLSLSLSFYIYKNFCRKIRERDHISPTNREQKYSKHQRFFSVICDPEMTCSVFFTKKNKNWEYLRFILTAHATHVRMLASERDHMSMVYSGGAFMATMFCSIMPSHLPCFPVWVSAICCRFYPKIFNAASFGLVKRMELLTPEIKSFSIGIITQKNAWVPSEGFDFLMPYFSGWLEAHLSNLSSLPAKEADGTHRDPIPKLQLHVATTKPSFFGSPTPPPPAPAPATTTTTTTTTTKTSDKNNNNHNNNANSGTNIVRNNNL